jgi:hypothetical protein
MKAAASSGVAADDDHAPPLLFPSRPALADLINGTGVFAHQQHEDHDDFFELEEAPPTKRQRTLWPTPGGGASGMQQVRSGRIVHECVFASPLSALPSVFSRSNSHLGMERTGVSPCLKGRRSER